MRKMTHEQFLKKIPKNVVCIGKYKNTRERISVFCSICSFSWEPVANSLLRGHGCPKCGQEVAKNVKKWNITQEYFLSKIPKHLSDKIEVREQYQSVHSDIHVRCKDCDHIWVSSPYKLYKGYGCDSCTRKANGKLRRKSHDQFTREVNEIHYGSVKLLDSYQTGEDRITVQCAQCDYIWRPVACRLLRRGCPRCISSKGEKKIERILIENQIPYKRQFSFLDLPNLKFDFAIFKIDGSLKKVVEYDGQQHFKPVKAWGGESRYKRQLVLDDKKNKFCLDNKIQLTRIPFSQYRNISLEMIL